MAGEMVPLPPLNFNGGSAAPSGVDAMFGTDLVFDNSGWNVSFGNSKIDSLAKKNTEQGGASSTGQVGDYMPYVVVILGMVIAWKTLKKS